MNSPIPSTRNEAWGFSGTIARIETASADAQTAWALAYEAIRAATGASSDAIRFFLDSRQGRHFADDVAGELFKGGSLTESIDAATARWMGWSIGRRTSRETGIPAGLPYLTGFVINAGIEADLEA
jgi:hypothetical protein